MVPATCGNLGPGLEYRGSFTRLKLRELNRPGSAALDGGRSSGSTNVLYPFGTLSEHRHEVAPTLMRDNNKNARDDTTASSVLGLQCEQHSRRKAKTGQPGVNAAPQSANAGRAPIPVEVAQVTGSFGRIFVAWQSDSVRIYMRRMAPEFSGRPRAAMICHVTLFQLPMVKVMIPARKKTCCHQHTYFSLKVRGVGTIQSRLNFALTS